VKRTALIKKVGKQARSSSRTWALKTQGTNHEIWICGETQTAIPRHSEINEFTAEAIMKDLEPELGEDWWRK